MDEQKYKDIIKRLILEKEIMQVMLDIEDVTVITKEDEEFKVILLEKLQEKRDELAKIGERGKLTL